MLEREGEESEMCSVERCRREKVYLELELQKHQRELLVFEKELRHWTPLELKESKCAFGSERKTRSRE